MADVQIPTELAQLQARATAAFDTVCDHSRGVGAPGLEWSDEERARSRELMAAA